MRFPVHLCPCLELELFVLELLLKLFVDAHHRLPVPLVHLRARLCLVHHPLRRQRRGLERPDLTFALGDELQDMRAKGVEMKQEEQVSFAAYKQFCEDTSAEKKSNIEDAEGQIETLQADIQKAESDAAMLAKDIAELDDEIATAQHDKAEAIRIRESEKGDFGKKHKDLSETIDALDRALVVLKQQDFDRAQAESLLQEVSVLARVPTKQKNVLAADRKSVV